MSLDLDVAPDFADALPLLRLPCPSDDKDSEHYYDQQDTFVYAVQVLESWLQAPSAGGLVGVEIGAVLQSLVQRYEAAIDDDAARRRIARSRQRRNGAAPNASKATAGTPTSKPADGCSD